MSDKFYVYRPLIELIGFTEGTAKGRGYNETLAYGAYTGGDVDLVSMTLDEVDALQTKMLRHPKNKMNSSAVGLPQIVRTTMRNIRKDLPERFPGTRLFDKACQDEMACYLLGVRGVDKYLSGRLKEDTLINNLAKEWASLPTTRGMGHYDGQDAAVSPARVREALAEVRKRHAEGQPIERVQVPVPVDRPVAPPQIDKPVEKTTGFWERLTTILGAFGIAGGAWLQNWQTVVAIAGAIVLLAIVGLFLHKRIIDAVKAIKRAKA